MKRGEVWWVAFDPAVGSEVRKRRPAVIVSNNAANRHLSRVVVVPLTSRTEHVYPWPLYTPDPAHTLTRCDIWLEMICEEK